MTGSRAGFVALLSLGLAASAGCNRCSNGSDRSTTPTSWKTTAALVDVRHYLERPAGPLPCAEVEGISVSRELSPLEAHELLLAARSDPDLRDAHVVVASAEAELLIGSTLENICSGLAELPRSSEVVTLADRFDGQQRASLEADLVKRMTDPRTLEVLRRFGVNAPHGELPDDDDEPLSSLLHALEPSREPWPPKRIASRDASSGLSMGLRLAGPYIAHAHRDVQSIHWDFPLAADERAMRLFVTKGEASRAPVLLGWSRDAKRARLLRKWNERYGAEVVFLGRDRMELFVPRRPLDVPELTNLVREQMAFAPELGQADDWVIAALTNVLGHRWAFWWD